MTPAIRSGPNGCCVNVWKWKGWNKMAKYRFRREDSGSEVCFEMSQAQFAQDCVEGLMLRHSSLTGKTIRYRFVRVERLRLPDGVMAFGCAGTYPMESDSMGVNPEQVDEAMAAARAMGVPVDFNRETGAVKFEDRHQRRRYCEAMGMVDFNGGYSDPKSMTDEERHARYPQAMQFLEN